MISVKIIGALMVSCAAIFGGHNRFKRWLHNRRLKRNQRYKQKLHEAWLRRFMRNQAEIDESWERDHPSKKQNIIVKGAMADMASAWGVGVEA